MGWTLCNFSIFNQETIVNENQLVEMMMVHVKLPRFSQGVIINFDRFIQKRQRQFSESKGDITLKFKIKVFS